MRVLFIGNSYTYFNDLPTLLVRVALADGVAVEADSSVSGGYTLAQHVDPSDPVGALTLRKLQAPWDFVILQEQSRRPVIPKERDEFMRPAVDRISSSAKANNSKVVLYMTWGRRFGDAKTGFDTYYEMQDALVKTYTSLGSEFGVQVAPVGIAFREALKTDREIALWDPDNSHPSPLGSLLAAYVIYSTLTGNDPINCVFTGDAAAADADILRQAAHRAMNLI